MTMINPSLFEKYLDEKFPHAKCELNYTKDYELAIAVMLSSQTTDNAVNGVTKVLFSKYQNIEDFANAVIKDIEEIIKPIGLYKNKAKHIIEFANQLVNLFSGKLPSDKAKLVTLSGIGNKSAGVIRAEVFKIPDFPVDTHVLRISKRLGFCDESDSPFECEQKLKKLFDKSHWIKLHHQFIFFGRYFCLSRKPDCQNCKIVKFCKEN